MASRPTPILPAAALLGGTSGKLPPDAFLGAGSSLPPSAFLPSQRPTGTLPRLQTSHPQLQEALDKLPDTVRHGVDQLGSEYLRHILTRYGYSESEARSMADAFKAEHEFGGQRHRSALTMLGRGLQGIENVSSGFVEGDVKTLIRSTKAAVHGDVPSILETVATPWLIVHAAANGFKEVPHAVGENLTYQKVIQKHTDPSSFLYQYSMPIGLGMSVLFDPTTYLSFGATAPSKIAAEQLLAHADQIAYKEAARRVTEAQKVKSVWHHTPETTNPITRTPYSWHNFQEAVQAVKEEHNLPFSLGDALDHLRQSDLAMKRSIRETGGYTDEYGNVLDAGIMKKIGARNPMSVLGGRGTRFMGQEIPGTARLGAKLGADLRGAEPAGTKVIAGLTPEWAARHVVADGVRSSALVELTRFRGLQQHARSAIAKEVRPLQKVTVSELGVRGKPVTVSARDRVNLLHKSGDTVTDPALRNLRNNIEADAEFHILKAIKSGANEDDTRHLWSELSKTYHDPLYALYEFKLKATLRHLSHDWTQKILKDRRFALPMATKAELKKGELTGLLEEVPTGYKMFQYGGRRYVVHNAIVEAVEKTTNHTVMDKEFSKFAGIMTALNKPQQFWKMYATSPNPAFHVMNFLGAFWNNMLAGIYNPIDYYKAAQLLYRGRREEAAQTGEKFLGRAAESSPEGKAALKTLDEASKRTGLGQSSFLFEDVYQGTHLTPGARKAAQEEIAQPEGASGRLKNLVRPEPGSGVVGATKLALKRSRQGAGIAAGATLNPVAFALLAPEAAKIGRMLGGNIEDMVRLVPFTKYANHPAIKAALEEYGPIIVNGARHPGWTKAQQQVMYDVGAHMSTHFQFDYTHLTYFERYIAKTMFPFWTYYRKNFVLQATNILKQPRKYAAALAMEKYMSQNADAREGPWKELLPNYFENLNAFQIPVPTFARKALGLPEKEPLYLNPKMPFVSLNLIPPVWDIVRDPATPTPQKFLEAIQPVMNSVGPWSPFMFTKVGLEYGTGWNFGLNRPIDFRRASSNDIQNSYQPAPPLMKIMPDWIKHNLFHTFKAKDGTELVTASGAYLFNQMGGPFINNLGQSLPQGEGTTQEKGKARANLISWLTGVRLIPFDILKSDRNTAYTIRDILKSKQETARRQGKELDDKEWGILDTLNSVIPELNDAVKARGGG